MINADIQLCISESILGASDKLLGPGIEKLYLGDEFGPIHRTVQY